jgi:hypothetical protein
MRFMLQNLFAIRVSGKEKYLNETSV